MKHWQYTLLGYSGFVIASAICTTLAILTYSKISDKNVFLIALILVLVTVFSATILAFLDHFRRKIMIDKPVNEILKATDKITKGDFSIKLTPTHSYECLDEFDIIKENLNNMANELSKSEILKTDFIANVSHEIKTPINVIQSYAKLLENKNLKEEEKKKYLHALNASCYKLNSLITNILKLNKLENNKLLPEYTKFNLSEVLTNQILQFETILEEKNINLICNIEENLYINSEESYMEIIFNNLMSNAIKFSNIDGTIEVDLKKENDLYVVSVKDNGIGMDEETGKRIFDKFYQGDTSHSSEGNGLGLSLVKKIIDVMGGSIQVESEKGVGTTFVIKVKEVI